MYEWDDNKNQLNLKKHGLDFSLAIEVFSDSNAFVQDNRVINGEVREQIIGKLDNEIVILFVVYTKREKKIRIISARKASKKERYIYENETRTD
jgi:uncharacterized DUF497 family protein